MQQSLTHDPLFAAMHIPQGIVDGNKPDLDLQRPRHHLNFLFQDKQRGGPAGEEMASVRDSKVVSDSLYEKALSLSPSVCFTCLTWHCLFVCSKSECGDDLHHHLRGIMDPTDNEGLPFVRRLEKLNSGIAPKISKEAAVKTRHSLPGTSRKHNFLRSPPASLLSGSRGRALLQDNCTQLNQLRLSNNKCQRGLEYGSRSHADEQCWTGHCSVDGFCDCPDAMKNCQGCSSSRAVCIRVEQG